MGVFENRVLRKISGPKRDKETGELRRLHDQELHDLHSSTNIIRVIILRIRLAGHVARRDRRGVYKVFVGKPEGKRPLGRSRRKWEEILKFMLKVLAGRPWIGLI